MKTERMRPYRLGGDHPQITALSEVAYVEDHRRLGTDAHAGASSERRLARLLALLGGIIPPLRDLYRGFVWESDGRVVAHVQFVRVGRGDRRWSIETVMTHPDHRRRGLARRLVGESLASIRGRGGRECVLKVREDNPNAYRLYESLGFVHYETSVHLRCDVTPDGGVVSVPGYRVRRIDPAEWFDAWKERAALMTRCSTDATSAFATRSEASYQRPKAVRWIAPFALRMSGRQAFIWFVEHEGRLVGTLRVFGDRAGSRPHEIDIALDPHHAEQLAAPLVDRALNALTQLPKTTVLIETGGHEACLLQALDERGFDPVTTWHALGKELAPGAA